MNDIDQRLQELGAKIPTPDVPVADDLARGRRRLGLHRLLVTGGTVAAVAVIAVGVALAGDVFDDGASAGPASTPSSAPSPRHRSSPKASEPTAAPRASSPEASS